MYRPTGYYVSPIVSPSDRARLSHWNLECIEASADQFLAALAQA